MKKYIFTLLIIFLLIVSSMFDSNTTITYSKQVMAGNATLFDLTMLSSLVYEDVPNDSNYTNNGSFINGCIKNNNLVENCSYTHINGATFRREGFNVTKYVEGLSQRKYGIMAMLSLSPLEDGPKYYFNNYASVEEATDWKVFDYKSDKRILDIIHFSNKFDAVTFKRGNDYVIAFRGTDFPDVAEWIADIAYLTGVHSQAGKAYNYAIQVYDKIVAKTPNANIYVTGHSLGGYLAQIGGAAIIQHEKDLKKSTSNLEQVVYLNGMGISAFATAIFKTVPTTGMKNIDVLIDNLYYLATTKRNGAKVTDTSNHVNYPGTNIARKTNYNEYSSGRLVSYRIEADPISDVGIHLGEVTTLERSIDSIRMHSENDVSDKVNEIINTVSPLSDKKIVEFITKFKESIKKGLANIANSLKKTLVATAATKFIKNLAVVKEMSDTFEVQLPSSMKSSSKTLLKKAMANKTINTFFDVLGTITYTNLSTYGLSVLQSANISHETDSFACYRSNPKDSSSLSFSLQGNTMKYKNQTGDGYNGGTIYYRMVGTNYITANLTGACSRNYEWNNTSSSDNKYKIKNVNSNLNFKVDFYNKFIYNKLSSDGSEYKTYSSSTQNSDSINKSFRFIRDNTSPTCSISSTYLRVKKSKGFSSNSISTTISCSDNSGGVGISSVSASAKKQGLLSITYASFNSCSDGGNSTTCSFKSTYLTGTNTYKITVTAKDGVGNTRTETYDVTVENYSY